MILHTQKLLPFVLIMFIFMGLTTPPASLALQNATLSVDPPSGTITSPTYTINIRISYVENLWIIHFLLSFNDDIDFLEVNRQGIEPGDLTGPRETWEERMDSRVGSVGGITYLNVTVFMPNWENNGTVTGEGTIAKITFDLMDNARPEMTSWLKLEDADAVINTGAGIEPLQLTLESGTVQVGLLTTALTLSAPSTATVEKSVTLSANLTDGVGDPISGQTIDYYVNSLKWGSDNTDIYGVSSITYTPTEVGTLNIQAIYNGSLRYASSSSAIVQITVNKLNTILTLDVPLSIKVQDTVDLIATLKKDTEPTPTPIVGATIGFSISPIGWTASETTNSDGVASIKYTFNNIDYYEIKAEYLGTEKYLPSSDSVNRTVAEIYTTLTLNARPIFVKVDEPITLNATLKDEGGNLLDGQSIHFYVDSEEVPGSPVTTDSSGVASIEYRPPIAGFFKVRAVFEGKLPYIGSERLLFDGVGGILVSHIPTNLNLSIPTTATVDKATVITATLKDDGGNLLDGQSIHFYVDSEEVPGSPVTTDSSGVASLSYTPLAVGTFQIEALYNGSAKYDGSSDEGELEVKRLTTTLSLSVPTPVRVEDKIAFIATLKDPDEKPIPNSTIDYEIFSIGWNPLGSAVTNASGDASFSFVPMETGTFNIRAKFAGDEKHTGSTSEEATFTVNKVNTTLAISMSNTTTTVQRSVTISATLEDEDGNPLPDSIVYYYILRAGAWVGIGSTPTNQEGIASMEYPPSETGTFKFKATYKGDQKYAESTSEEITLEVTQEMPETSERPFIDLSFLTDAKLTVLDILFWGIIILSFSTIVVVIIWKKIK